MPPRNISDIYYSLVDSYMKYGSISKKKPYIPEIERVIFNGPCTIILWADKTKTIVRCTENDTFDPEKGLAMAISKKALGNNGNYYDIFKKFFPSIDEDCETEPK